MDSKLIVRFTFTVSSQPSSSSFFLFYFLRTLVYFSFLFIGFLFGISFLLFLEYVLAKEGKMRSESNPFLGCTEFSF